MQTIKVLGSELTLNSTASTINSAAVVRLINANTTGPHVITQKDASNNTIGTLTVMAAESIALIKAPSDVLTVDSGSDVKAVKIAFTN